jgi:Fe-S cluster biogenesis protein NfuA
MTNENTIEIIKKQIKEKVRPALIVDGGNIEFVEYNETEGILKVKLLGSCNGCPMASFTLKNAVYEVLKEYVPEITEVVAIDFNSDKIEVE